MTEVLRDFLIHKYGEALDVTRDSSKLSCREKIMVSFIKEASNKTFSRTIENTIDSRLTAEYILILCKPSLTKYQKKKIKEILLDHFKYTLYNHMAMSRSEVMERRIKEFIEYHNIFAENALENIKRDIARNQFYNKTKRS